MTLVILGERMSSSIRRECGPGLRPGQLSRKHPQHGCIFGPIGRALGRGRHLKCLSFWCGRGCMRLSNPSCGKCEA